jgi:hypothetical protein
MRFCMSRNRLLGNWNIQNFKNQFLDNECCGHDKGHIDFEKQNIELSYNYLRYTRKTQTNIHPLIERKEM